MRKDERSPLRLESQPVGEARVTMVVEFSCAVSGAVEDLDRAKSTFEELAKEFSAKCRDLDVGTHLMQGSFRPMTREEAVSFTPRRFHYAPDGERVCDTAYVSPRQLTDDRSKVTCKLCLKRMEENGERLEAGGGEKKGRKERKGP